MIDWDQHDRIRRHEEAITADLLTLAGEPPTKIRSHRLDDITVVPSRPYQAIRIA